MTPKTKTSPSTTYTPDSDASRAAPSSRGFLRRVSFSETVAALLLIGGGLSVLGWRRVSYDELEGRITANTKRIEALESRLTLTNYMLCVQLRKNDPASLPSDCSPIFDARGAR
jgi:hypothetical protein